MLSSSLHTLIWGAWEDAGIVSYYLQLLLWGAQVRRDVQCALNQQLA